MITESYPLEHSNYKTLFRFKSVGKKGIIEKAILFQSIRIGRFNLAFGGVQGKEIDDKVVSDNGDLSMVISTVAQSIYIFLESYPNAKIEIKGVDKRRMQLYSHIIRRRKLEIESFFEIFGEINNELEPFEVGRVYDKFVIQRKNK